MNHSAILAFLCFIFLQTHGVPTSAQDRPDAGIDVLHYDYTISLPDSGRDIQGRARIQLKRSRDIHSVTLDLAFLRVDSVGVDGIGSDFTRDSLQLTVPLPPRRIQACDTLTVLITYRGMVRDGLIIQPDDKGRWSAFGDNWPQRARFWIPCIDRPDDKATVTWRVIAPSDREVVANGALVERIPLPSAAGYHRVLTVWNESIPISTYLMVIAVGTLAKYDLPSHSQNAEGSQEAVQQSVYVQPELLNFLPGPFKYADDIVAYFSSLIGPFPYEKLAHIQSSTRYGGMENASAIFYADQGFETRSMGPGVIAHETAHQWFGDAVTELQWSHLWLSEGFATYFEELWTLHQFGDSAFKAEMIHAREEVLRSRVVRERPVIDSMQTNLMRLLDVNSYQKGAWVLHMLRSILGDSVFFSSIRSYFADYRDSTALSDDLEREFEHKSHEDLRWFFDQWLRRPGYITLASTWSYDKSSRQVRLTLEQPGPFPPYRFPLIIESIAISGARNREMVMVQPTATNVFTLQQTFNERPGDIVLDPDVQLLARIISR